MAATCFDCKAEVLTVTVRDQHDTEVLTVDPEPHHEGDLQVRHRRWGWQGHRTTPDAPQWLGWTKRKKHSCTEPMEAKR